MAFKSLTMGMSEYAGLIDSPLSDDGFKHASC